jgi:APA family basic amino acid/polyamine antiporter
MARGGDAPSWLAAVHPRFHTPYRAEIAVGVLVVVLIAFGDLRGAIGFSSFTILGYYAIANASALTLPRGHARGSRLLPAVGIAGCIALAACLPAATVLQGAIVLGAGALLAAVRHTARD